MQTSSVFLPSYTIGDAQAYDSIGDICKPFGRKAVLIGGKTALAKSEKAIREAAAKGGIEIIDALWYGGDATRTHINELAAHPSVQAADMLFAAGGGRALDAVKTLHMVVAKPVFTFPTICSNCAPVTRVCVLYDDNHVFSELAFMDAPPQHCFINTEIIAAAPLEYLWAGIGDALSKQYESAFSARDKKLPHSNQVGVDIGHNCARPLLDNGIQAYQDAKDGKLSEALAEVILNIIVTTGLVSVLVDNDYNSNAAHSIYYGSTALAPLADGSERLHGQVVSYGVLVLLAMDGQEEAFREVYAFNKALGLPTCLADISVFGDDKDKLLDAAVKTKDIDCSPYKVTREMLEKAVDDIENYSA